MTGITAEPQFELEARDTELAISLWNDKAKQFGKPPPVAEFDLVGFTTKPNRFVICADLFFKEASVFLDYGPGFAKLLGLPKRPLVHVPMIRCIPERYRFLFSDGCREAIDDDAPAQFSGEIAGSTGVEVYRACFMPLRMNMPNLQTIYGSFNFMVRPTAGARSRYGSRLETERAGLITVKRAPMKT